MSTCFRVIAGDVMSPLTTYVTETLERVVDVPHWVVGEGHGGHVSGKGVPPGGEGGLSQPVPEDSHPLPFPPTNTNDK